MIGIASGRIVADAELKTSSSGNSYVKFAVVENQYDSKTKKGVSVFYNCVAFDKLAERAEKILKKGASTVVVGRLTSEIGKNGQVRHNMNVTDFEVLFSQTNPVSNDNSEEEESSENVPF